MFKIFQKEDIERRKKYIEDKKNELEYIYSTYNLSDDEFKEIISYFKLDDELEIQDFIDYIFKKNKMNLDRVDVKDINEDELRVNVKLFFEDVKNKIEKGNKDKNEIAFDFRIDKFLRKKFENYEGSFLPMNYRYDIVESVKNLQKIFIPKDKSESLITDKQVEIITEIFLSGKEKLEKPNGQDEQDFEYVKEWLNILFTKSVIYQLFREENIKILKEEVIDYYDRLYVMFNYHLEDKFLNDDFRFLKDNFEKILPEIHKEKRESMDSNEKLLKALEIENDLENRIKDIDRRKKEEEYNLFVPKLEIFKSRFIFFRRYENNRTDRDSFKTKKEYDYIKNYTFSIMFDENISLKVKKELLYAVFISLSDFFIFGLNLEKWKSWCENLGLSFENVMMFENGRGLVNRIIDITENKRIDIKDTRLDRRERLKKSNQYEKLYFSKELESYLLNKPSIFIRYVNILDLSERDKKILDLRLEGNSLEKIAELVDLKSKERVRQILNSIVNKKNELDISFREDIYSSLFRIYNYTEENFKELIKTIESKHRFDSYYKIDLEKYVDKVYRYLNIFYKKGEEDISLVLRKQSYFPKVIIEKTLEFNREYSEVEIVKKIDKEEIVYLVENSKNGLLNYFIKEFGEENISYKYFNYVLNNLVDYGYEIKNKNINDEVARFSKEGTFDKNDIDECFYVLSSGNTFRYYNPYNKDVFENLIRILKLDCYTFRYDVKALYDDYKKVMEDYDIRNEKELLYILKKINNIKDLNINFYHYTLWKGNRYRIDYLNLDLSSPEQNTLYNKQIINEAINLFKNNCLSILDENVCLGSKLKDRYLDFYCEKLSKSQEEKEQLLNEEVNISDYVITKDVLKDVGYNVENGYVYSNKEYTNLEEALSSIFEKKLKRVPIEEYDGTSEFYKILEKVKKSYGYICGATKSYLKSKGINTDKIPGIIKESLKNFEECKYIPYEKFLNDDSIKKMVNSIFDVISENEENDLLLNEIGQNILCQIEEVSVSNLKIGNKFYMLFYFGKNKRNGINDFLSTLFYEEKLYILSLDVIKSYLKKYVKISEEDFEFTFIKEILNSCLMYARNLRGKYLIYVDYDFYKKEKE